MNEKLKPCAYCGGEGIVGCSYADLFERYCDWFIECAECGATNINPTRGYGSREEAAKAWNMRVNEQPKAKSLLKPCPHCGGEASVDFDECSEEYVVYCHNPKCSWQKTEEEAI